MHARECPPGQVGTVYIKAPDVGRFEDYKAPDKTDSQIKLALIEQEHVQAPGWVDVVLGLKPLGERQGSLFEIEW